MTLILIVSPSSARQHRQLHPHLPDRDHGVPDVRGQEGAELGPGDARRPHVSHHVLFGGESGRVGAGRCTASDLQARVSKVPEAIHEICD